jgi:hypothetical protein
MTIERPLEAQFQQRTNRRWLQILAAKRHILAW